MAVLPLDRGLQVLSSRARIVHILLIAFMALSVFMMFLTAAEAMGVINLDQSADAATLLVIFAGSIAYVIVFIASIIFVALWIYRANANLHAAGMEVQYSPGWSVGWFFVPIANLFKPFEAMREISQRSLAHSGHAASSDLGFWWGGWIIGNILSNIAFRLELAPGAGLTQPFVLLDSAGSVGLIVSAWFLARIVKEITACQDGAMTVAEVFS